MKLKKLTICSLLLAIGLILHQIAPPIFLGMKPDFSLVMMFIALMVVANDYKTSLVVGIASGLLTAATTTFPAGQLPNIIDKLVTFHILFLIIKFTETKLNSQVRIAIISIIGTLISGSVFLGSALLLFSLPAPFTALFAGVVLPSTLANTVAGVILYNAVFMALKRSKSF
ncbi:tryptophan transporter [Clostridium oceanicum]|uniref:Tryptophan transporter n=1 Tax=Clostridium oceanicum TaxID=1543 RepID=A0ABN1JUZ3_9CLOT